MHHKQLAALLTIVCCLSLSCNLLSTATTPIPEQKPINVETSVAGTLAFEAAVQTAAAGLAPAAHRAGGTIHQRASAACGRTDIQCTNDQCIDGYQLPDWPIDSL